MVDSGGKKKRLAVLMYGLLRGAGRESLRARHRQALEAMSQFATLEIFGFFGLSQACDEASARAALADAFDERRHEIAFSTRRDEAEETRILGAQRPYLFQFYKLKRVFSMMVAREKARRWKFDVVFAARFDGYFETADFSGVFDALDAEPRGILAAHDFCTFATRDAAKRLPKIWLFITRLLKARSKKDLREYVPIDWNRYARSDWAWNCSYFSECFNWPAKLGFQSDWNLTTTIAYARTALPLHPDEVARSNKTYYFAHWHKYLNEPEVLLGLAMLNGSDNIVVRCIPRPTQFHLLYGSNKTRRHAEPAC